MNATTQQILAHALALPEAERADLAAELIGSLDAQVDDDAQQQWTKEIERRIAELDAGTVTTIPWTEIRRRLMGEDGSRREAMCVEADRQAIAQAIADLEVGRVLRRVWG